MGRRRRGDGGHPEALPVHRGRVRPDGAARRRDRHASLVARLTGLFGERLRGRSIVWPQNPVGLRVVRSVPQPDVTLVRPRADFYAKRRPGPEDVLLLIKVMDTSAETDRSVKLPLYARAGIAEVWVRQGRSRRTSARP